jgi:ribosomal protein L16/L10AE
LREPQEKLENFGQEFFLISHTPKKPPEVTMGAGKGDPDHYVASVSPGRVLF